MKNNRCATIEGKLVDYADGELPGKDVDLIEAHLAGCSVCRELVVHLNRSLGACQTLWEDKLAETAPPPTTKRESDQQGLDGLWGWLRA